jgi:hypothetical protein
MMEKKDTSSQAIPYTRGLVFILINRYVYPSQAHASFTFVTVPKATSAFRLSFKDPRNCKMNMINNKLFVNRKGKQSNKLANTTGKSWQIRNVQTSSNNITVNS